MSDDNNPHIGGLLLGVTWIEVLILVWAGLGLLLYPPVIEPLWPWPLAPFNLRFLGALYSAALISAFLQAWSGRWSPARVVTPMIFVFTLVVSLYSFLHLDRFDLARPESWVWFILYVGVCLNAGFHLVLYRGWGVPTPGAPPVGAPRIVLTALAAALGAYGLALLAAPVAASWFWPWRLDDFHGQLYSVTFLTPALGAWVLLRGATPGDRRAFGLTLAAWGMLPILALVGVDATIKRVHWDQAGTWLWLALFGVMAWAGAWLAAGTRAGLAQDTRPAPA
jgi:hypothetical protein